MVVVSAASVMGCSSSGRRASSKVVPPLWRTYERALKGAKYVDLTHTITPSIPVWAGFERSTFAPVVNPKTGVPYQWARDWFEATRFVLATDQLGTQLDPPALKSLHEQRHILFHGHEPLDTDATPTFEAEAWLLQNGYTQAEGMAHLDQVPEAGALVTMGFPKLKGGLGGYARYIAICPPDWKYGVSPGEIPESPLARSSRPLRWDATRGMRVR